MRILPVLFMAGVTALYTSVSGQTNTISPYSFYGVGELHTTNFTTRGMGGAGTGIALYNQINFQNPAALGYQDTMSFIFNTSFSLRNTQIASTARSGRINQLSLDHLAISFPLMKRLALSAGITPYSQTGYKVSQISRIDSSEQNARYWYEGSGGLSKVFAGLGGQISDQLSVGLNGSFVFGEIAHTEQIVLLNGDLQPEGGTYDTKFLSTYNLQGFGIMPAILVKLSPASDHQLTGGITWDYTFDLNTQIEITNKSNAFKDSSYHIENYSGYSRLPQIVSTGIAYQYKKTLMLAADYQYTKWSDTYIYTRKQNLTNAHGIRFGVQYIPRPEKPRHYYEKIAYRAGVNYNTGNIRVEGSVVSTIGLTAGLGLPYKNTKSRFDLSYEYNKRGKVEAGHLQEINHWITINISLFDIWFYQQKLD